MSNPCDCVFCEMSRALAAPRLNRKRLYELYNIVFERAAEASMDAFGYRGVLRDLLVAVIEDEARLPDAIRAAKVVLRWPTEAVA